MTDPTYNVPLTTKQIRALGRLTKTIIDSPLCSAETEAFYRNLAATLNHRLKQIEAKKGEAT